MMTFSLMTTSMVFPLVGKLHAGVPMDVVRHEYADMLAMVAACGIPAVEITGLELDVFGFYHVQEGLNRAGLRCASVIQMDTYAQTDGAKHDTIVTAAKQKILEAKALGAGHVMLGLMAQDDVTQHSTASLREALIRNFQPIADFGAAQGMVITIEDTPDIRLPMCDSADIRPILEAIPTLSLTYDTGNMLLKKEDSLTFYRALKDRVAYVHLKDMAYCDEAIGDRDVEGRYVHTAIHGSGMLDFKAILGELRKDGYDGWLMLEYAGQENHAANIRAAREMMETLSSTKSEMLQGEF